MDMQICRYLFGDGELHFRTGLGDVGMEMVTLESFFYATFGVLAPLTKKIGCTWMNGGDVRPPYSESRVADADEVSHVIGNVKTSFMPHSLFSPSVHLSHDNGVHPFSFVN